jgi:hypothetical protein
MKHLMFMFLVSVFFIGCSKPEGVRSLENRVALVIGNDNYLHISDLNNAKNDAKDVGDVLEKLGFQVLRVADGNKEKMEESVANFITLLKKDKETVGMIFYAGHGVEGNGENFLIPIDANIKSEAEIKNNAVSLNDILSKLEIVQNRLNILVLDACRNNPFEYNIDGSRILKIQKGLTNPPQAQGVYIAYSADVNQEAFDGTGENSIFTTHLLDALQTKGLKLNEVFQEVRKNVEEETGKTQSPASYDKTTGEFYFYPEDINISENNETNTSKSREIKGDFIWTGKDLRPLSTFDFNFEDVIRDIDELVEERLPEEYKKVEGTFNEVFSFRNFSYPDFIFEEVLEPKDDEWETEEEFRIRKQKFGEKKNKAYEEYESRKKLAFEEFNDEKNRAKQGFENRKANFLQRYKDDRAKKISQIKTHILQKRQEIFNSLLGQQNISMTYNPEIKEFTVTEYNLNIQFQFAVEPVPVAKKFKKETKNMNFIFEETNGQFFLVGIKAGNFSTRPLYISGIVEKSIAIEKDRLRKLEEERLRKLEEEKARKLEEERLRKLEEERLIEEIEEEFETFIILEEVAVLGKDFRTLTLDENYWNKDYQDKVICENNFHFIPDGWHIANEERVKEIVKFADFKTHVLVASNGKSYGTKTYNGGILWSSSNNLVKDGNQARTGACSLAVLLERDGVENLKLKEVE